MHLTSSPSEEILDTSAELVKASSLLQAWRDHGKRSIDQEPDNEVVTNLVKAIVNHFAAHPTMNRNIIFQDLAVGLFKEEPKLKELIKAAETTPHPFKLNGELREMIGTLPLEPVSAGSETNGHVG